MKILDIQQAAKFLHMHVDTVQRRAKAGQIPAAKLGKCWVFIDTDLADYIRSQYAKPCELDASQGVTTSCYTKEKIVPIGILNSPSRGKRYTDLLERKTEKKPKK